MARIARIIAPGCPHHVAVEAQKGKKLFARKGDYEAYLGFLQESAAENKLDILAWCLLPDRGNLVVIPRAEESLQLALRRANSVYSRYAKEKRRLTTALWKDRFQSCPLDNPWALEAIRYVERLPVAEKKALRPEAYAWSSAAAHCRKRGALGADMLASWAPAAKVGPWASWLKKAQDPEKVEELLSCTRRGYALGAKAFLARLEKKLGRPVA